jgi:hypothetical protein
MIQLFMEPPLFHYNCAYATNLFAGYSTKTTEKRQNQPQISRIKTDLKLRMKADVVNAQRREGSAGCSTHLPLFAFIRVHSWLLLAPSTV